MVPSIRPGQPLRLRISYLWRGIHVIKVDRPYLCREGVLEPVFQYMMTQQRGLESNSLSSSKPGIDFTDRIGFSRRNWRHAPIARWTSGARNRASARVRSEERSSPSRTLAGFNKSTGAPLGPSVNVTTLVSQFGRLSRR